MNKRYALGFCGLAFLSVATSLATVNLAAWAAQTEGGIPKMTPFDLPPSYGRGAVDIANLDEHGNTRLASDEGSIRLAVRYQIKTTTGFANSPHRLVVKFLEPCSGCGGGEGGYEANEPIAMWTSPPITPGNNLHINEVAPLTLPCPQGSYRITIGLERYNEGIDRVRGPVAEWLPLTGRTYNLTVQ